MLKLLAFVGVPALAVATLGAGTTYVMSGTQSTTTLDDYSAVTVNGHKALSKDIVEGRTQSKYHPLPWIGTKVTDVSCPTGLPAVTGTTMTCSGKAGSKRISIPVTVVKISDNKMTWKFER